MLTAFWESEPKRKKDKTHQTHICTRTQWQKKPAFQRPINWLLIKFILYFIGQDRVNVSTNIKTTYFLCAFFPLVGKKMNKKWREWKRERMRMLLFRIFIIFIIFIFRYGSHLFLFIFCLFICYKLNLLVLVSDCVHLWYEEACYPHVYKLGILYHFSDCITWSQLDMLMHQ